MACHEGVPDRKTQKTDLALCAANIWVRGRVIRADSEPIFTPYWALSGDASTRFVSSLLVASTYVCSIAHVVFVTAMHDTFRSISTLQIREDT